MEEEEQQLVQQSGDLAVERAMSRPKRPPAWTSDYDTAQVAAEGVHKGQVRVMLSHSMAWIATLVSLLSFLNHAMAICVFETGRRSGTGTRCWGRRTAPCHPAGRRTLPLPSFHCPW